MRKNIAVSDKIVNTPVSFVRTGKRRSGGWDSPNKRLERDTSIMASSALMVECVMMFRARALTLIPAELGIVEL